jgi:hypothetical protein
LSCRLKRPTSQRVFFIKEFHDAFGLDQDGRDQNPYGDFHVEIRDDSGETLISRRNKEVVSQGFMLALQHNVTCGEKGGRSIRNGPLPLSWFEKVFP